MIETKHIVPVDDIFLHYYGVCCSCFPSLVVKTNGDHLVLHHAADRREEIEQLGLDTGKGWLTVKLKTT